MFWKKKSRDDLAIEVAKDKRASFRVQPPLDAPLIFYVGREAYQVRDISAGGASFAAPPGVTLGEVLTIRFRLPYSGLAIQVGFKVRGIREGTISGAFEGLSAADQENIHQYALEVQKNEARKKKRATRRGGMGRPQS